MQCYQGLSSSRDYRAATVESAAEGASHSQAVLNSKTTELLQEVPTSTREPPEMQYVLVPAECRAVARPRKAASAHRSLSNATRIGGVACTRYEAVECASSTMLLQLTAYGSKRRRSGKRAAIVKHTSVACVASKPAERSHHLGCQPIRRTRPQVQQDREVFLAWAVMALLKVPHNVYPSKRPTG